jgi:hypothetical protein
MESIHQYARLQHFCDDRKDLIDYSLFLLEKHYATGFGSSFFQSLHFALI